MVRASPLPRAASAAAPAAARLLALLLALPVGCGGEEIEPGGTEAPDVAGAPAPSDVHFVDVAAEVGLQAFRQQNGGPRKRHIPESNGGGVALLDYDRDGDLDVFLINGWSPGGFGNDVPREPLRRGETASNALFRNEGGGERFVDVTHEAGLSSAGRFGQGVAVADVNGDGWLDLYIANYGPNALYLSDGEGRFVESAAAAGVDDGRWSSGAGFLDADGDGDLDLYVANYLEYEQDLATLRPGETFVTDWQGQKVFGGPKSLTPAADRYYQNRGDGTYEDATAAAGLEASGAAYGFQVIVVDFDDDGAPDVFVSNDSHPNFLWRNGGDGTFTDVGGRTGLAYDEMGKRQASMGVACDDVDGDGWMDFYVTNFDFETNILYLNRRGEFVDVATRRAGLTGPRLTVSLGWGTGFFDLDHDGDLDLFASNGHVYPEADAVPGDLGYAQQNLLYLRGTGLAFEDVSDRAGPGLRLIKVSRGAAFGDLDDDGDWDVVVNDIDDTPTVLRNETPSLGSHVRVLLRGKSPNSAAIGARVAVVAGGVRRVREVRSSDSYLSHNDLRLHFGLGPARRVERIEVRWPGGDVEVVEDLEIDRLHVIEEGRGRVAD